MHIRLQNPTRKSVTDRRTWRRKVFASLIKENPREWNSINRAEIWDDLLVTRMYKKKSSTSNFHFQWFFFFSFLSVLWTKEIVETIHFSSLFAKSKKCFYAICRRCYHNQKTLTWTLFPHNTLSDPAIWCANTETFPPTLFSTIFSLLFSFLFFVSLFVKFHSACLVCFRIISVWGSSKLLSWYR